MKKLYIVFFSLLTFLGQAQSQQVEFPELRLSKYFTMGQDPGLYNWDNHQNDGLYKSRLFGKHFIQRLFIGKPLLSSGFDVYNGNQFSDYSLFVSGDVYFGGKIAGLKEIIFEPSSDYHTVFSMKGSSRFELNPTQNDTFGKVEMSMFNNVFTNVPVEVHAGGNVDNVSRPTMVVERLRRLTNYNIISGHPLAYSSPTLQPTYGYALEVKGEQKQGGYLNYSFQTITQYTGGTTCTLPYNKGVILLKPGTGATAASGTITINLAPGGFGETDYPQVIQSLVNQQHFQYATYWSQAANKNADGSPKTVNYTRENDAAALLFIKNNSGFAATFQVNNIPNGYGALLYQVGADNWQILMISNTAAN